MSHIWSNLHLIGNKNKLMVSSPVLLGKHVAFVGKDSINSRRNTSPRSMLRYKGEIPVRWVIKNKYRESDLLISKLIPHLTRNIFSSSLSVTVKKYTCKIDDFSKIRHLGWLCSSSFLVPKSRCDHSST